MFQRDFHFIKTLMRKLGFKLEYPYLNKQFLLKIVKQNL
jgi:hypothetical protein